MPDDDLEAFGLIPRKANIISYRFCETKSPDRQSPECEFFPVNMIDIPKTSLPGRHRNGHPIQHRDQHPDLRDEDSTLFIGDDDFAGEEN